MNRSFQRRLNKAAQGIDKLSPKIYTLAENREWAEVQLAEMMRDHRWSRERALALAKAHAPTIYEMLRQGERS